MLHGYGNLSYKGQRNVTNWLEKWKSLSNRFWTGRKPNQETLSIVLLNKKVFTRSNKNGEIRDVLEIDRNICSKPQCNLTVFFLFLIIDYHLIHSLKVVLYLYRLEYYDNTQVFLKRNLNLSKTNFENWFCNFQISRESMSILLYYQ